MNYLAHAYLSFNEPQILIGNMISDFVKGRAQFGYAANVQKGIQLHRAIDHFTDTHPSTKAAKEVFRGDYRLYSGAILDIIYDHFLANDPNHFNETSLFHFTEEVYSVLEDNAISLPTVFLQVLTYMRNENWMFHYRTHEGIRKSLRGLARRATYLTEGETAYGLFTKHYDELREHYANFFPDVKKFAKEEFDKLLFVQ